MIPQIGDMIVVKERYDEHLGIVTNVTKSVVPGYTLIDYQVVGRENIYLSTTQNLILEIISKGQKYYGLLPE